MPTQANLLADEWPIYSLANYEGGGSLIQLCRSILATSIDSSGADQTIDTGAAQRGGQRHKSSNTSRDQTRTSDYQTGEDQLSDKCNGAERRSKPPDAASPPPTASAKPGDDLDGKCDTSGEPIMWWHLAEKANNSCVLEAKREQIVQLCLSLQQIIRLVVE